jgi:hypothetical protein
LNADAADQKSDVADELQKNLRHRFQNLRDLR